MITSDSQANDFQMRFSDGEREALSDAGQQYGGAGDGFSPHSLLEAALGNCVGITVRMYAKKHDIPLESVRVTVRLDREDQAVADFRYAIELKGNLDQAQRDRLLRAARACSVHRTLMRKLTFSQVDEV
ncbi:OsmC family protein [Fundidesulfovibrio agrisoli]|uniref:OsmC family protein n=1 Tax=Fundidesulfovibrio agrisoli TaxID=2922717 RepID=UPI001FAC786C|nr:OsmC family protein [Fundidesulfovibrio agrisoli]